MTLVTGAMAFLSGRLVGQVGEWNAIVVGLTGWVASWFIGPSGRVEAYRR